MKHRSRLGLALGFTWSLWAAMACSADPSSTAPTTAKTKAPTNAPSAVQPGAIGTGSPEGATSALTIALPGGEGGVGLDDLRYSRALRRVLVPAGRTGKLDLIDPVTLQIESIGGFSEAQPGRGGHGEGTTSVDEGAGWLFAIDRTRRQLAVIDPASRAIVSTAPLAAGPDYVRFVALRRELWVTEPDAEQIEIFSLPEGGAPTPQRVGVVSVPGGPESLVIDTQRGLAYTHLWKAQSVAIDLVERRLVATWDNGCADSRGIALDEARGFLFTGCREGRATVLDVAHGGKLLSSAQTGAGVDIIDYDPARGHLYVPGGESATLTILGVSAQGELSVLGTAPTAKDSRQVTTDGEGRVFVGDPRAGHLFVIADGFPSSR